MKQTLRERIDEIIARYADQPDAIGLSMHLEAVAKQWALEMVNETEESWRNPWDYDSNGDPAYDGKERFKENLIDHIEESTK